MDPNYDPTIPYSEEIIINRPERIYSYDETKMELDCIKGSAGKRKRVVKPINDDGETLSKSRADVLRLHVAVSVMADHYPFTLCSRRATHMMRREYRTSAPPTFSTRTEIPYRGVILAT